VAAADKEGIAVPAPEAFESVTGMGVRAQVDGVRVEVGADRFMQQLGLDVGVFRDVAQRLGDEGKTTLYAAKYGKRSAIIAISDTIKPITPAAILDLHELGLKVAITTGDNARTANAIAERLGIDDVVAEVLPAGNVEAVQTLQARYGNV